MTTETKDKKAETLILTVPSHPKFLYVVRSALYPVVLDAGFSKKKTRELILAVDEACSNIIKYAYEEDHAKSIGVTVTVSAEELRIVLTDSGRQVERSTIAPRKLSDIRPGGLGTHFMHAVFDAVDYDTSGGEGTTLTLVKKRP